MPWDGRLWRGIRTCIKRLCNWWRWRQRCRLAWRLRWLLRY